MVFSASVIAASVKPGIVTVLAITDPLTLTYISRSIDFVNFYVEVLFFSALVIAASMKACIVNVLHIPFHIPFQITP